MCSDEFTCEVPRKIKPVIIEASQVCLLHAEQVLTGPGSAPDPETALLMGEATEDEEN